ncbi:MAG: protein kinase [Myxococcaceae bacterium]|nr:protein kinase [Myxococcaceae bacterium]
MLAFPVKSLSPGTRIGSRYLLERPLGGGGMGEVWEAVCPDTGGRVALKLPRGEGPETQRRLVREARALMALDHPHIVRVLEVGEEEGRPFLAMELLRGESLARRLEREGRVPLPELARLLLPVLDALEAAHARGVVHRDLKPSNLFLEEGGGGLRVLDFGIARLTASEGPLAQSGTLTLAGERVGTPRYMAPEQVFDDAEVDARTDLWALGVVLYEALLGKRPFDGERTGPLLRAITAGDFVPPEQVDPGLPTEVAALVRGLLSVAPEARPALTEVRGVLARQVGLPAPRARWRWERWAAAVGAGAVVMLVAVHVAMGRWWPPQPPLAGRRVLWVDDRPPNVASERARLERAGAEVVHALTTEEALRVLASRRVDLVITDLVRVEGQRVEQDAGYSLLARVRERPSPPPVALYTANVAAVDPALAAGALVVADESAVLLGAVATALGAPGVLP